MGQQCEESIYDRFFEYYFNDEPVVNSDTIKFKMFKKFWSDFNMKYPTYKPYRTECIIYDDDIKLSTIIKTNI